MSECNVCVYVCVSLTMASHILHQHRFDGCIVRQIHWKVAVHIKQGRIGLVLEKEVSGSLLLAVTGLDCYSLSLFFFLTSSSNLTMCTLSQDAAI